MVALIVLAVVISFAVWLCGWELTVCARAAISGKGARITVKSSLGPFMLPQTGAHIWLKGEPRAYARLGTRYFNYTTNEITRAAKEIFVNRRVGKTRQSSVYKELAKKVKLELMRVEINAGLGESGATAIFTGVIWWALSPLIAYCCANGLRPEISVYPDFYNLQFGLSAKCIFSTAFGQVIRAGIAYARQVLREARSNWITRLKTSCTQRWKASRT